jgi:ankyrin repeat protein
VFFTAYRTFNPEKLNRFMEQDSFFDAIRNGNLKTLKTLGEKDPGLFQAKDQRGSTPLILAAYYNQGEIVEYLLEKGVQVDDKDGAGNTALMGCCFKGYVPVAEKLIAAGADVNTVNSLGSTCLIYAVTFNQPEIAKLLLENGAETHIRDARGNTALDHAQMQGFTHFRTLLSS